MASNSVQRSVIVSKIDKILNDDNEALGPLVDDIRVEGCPKKDLKSTKRNLSQFEYVEAQLKQRKGTKCRNPGHYKGKCLFY